MRPRLLKLLEVPNVRMVSGLPGFEKENQKPCIVKDEARTEEGDFQLEMGASWLEETWREKLGKTAFCIWELVKTYICTLW